MYVCCGENTSHWWASGLTLNREEAEVFKSKPRNFNTFTPFSLTQTSSLLHSLQPPPNPSTSILFPQIIWPYPLILTSCEPQWQQNNCLLPPQKHWLSLPFPSYGRLSLAYQTKASEKLQCVQNAAAHLFTSICYHDHIISVLCNLCWLPVKP